MVQQLGPIIRNHWLALFLFFVANISFIVHGMVVTDAINNKAIQITALTQAVNQQNGAIQTAIRVFRRNAVALERSNRQSQANYDLVLLNRHVLLQIMELLFVPFEERPEVRNEIYSKVHDIVEQEKKELIDASPR